MNDIERKARELLLAQYLAAGYKDGDPLAVSDANTVAIKAIVAALTPPEGYVLVPVEPTEAMLESTGIGAEGLKRRVWGLMLAARPEVSQ